MENFLSYVIYCNLFISDIWNGHIHMPMQSLGRRRGLLCIENNNCYSSYMTFYRLDRAYIFRISLTCMLIVCKKNDEISMK